MTRVNAVCWVLGGIFVTTMARPRWGMRRGVKRAARYWRRRSVKRARRVYRRKGTRMFRQVRMGLGFPNRMKITHRYAVIQNHSTGTSGSLTTVSFAANGMYDPETVIGGHQPIYFDQMAAIYEKYTVIGSKITIDVGQAGDTAQSRLPVTFGIILDDDGNLTQSLQAIMENPVNKTKSQTTNAGATKRITHKFSAKKWFGKSPFGSSEFEGDDGNQPSQLAHFVFWADSSTYATDVALSLTVQIDYIAVWTQLKDIPES